MIEADIRELTRRNAAYGRGVFRRRVRLRAEPGRVRAAVEDTSHAMRVTLLHDGERVTGIESGMTRIPMSTCPGAAAPLRAFVGLPLAPYPSRPSAKVDARGNCTHLHHLALLAMAHAGRSGSRQYDIAIPDEHPAAVWSTVARDGVELHRWRTFDGRILAPQRYAGLPLLRGFSGWAPQHLDGDELEAAFVLCNAYLVSFARRYDTTAWAGERAGGHSHMVGKCYSYQPDVVTQGVYLADASLDTTAADTPLLADFD